MLGIDLPAGAAKAPPIAQWWAMAIEDDIITWALDRPAWQQEVLVALAEDQDFGTDRVSAVVDEIMVGDKSAPNQGAKRIQIKSAVFDQVRLAAACDLQGVNALVPGQRLDFSATGLTVIYGDNGSGKSGYARLIKSLVNARHRSDILHPRHPHVVHADRGTSMTSKTVAALLSDLEVTKSHSRPRVQRQPVLRIGSRR
jgi:hypothetical protein